MIAPLGGTPAGGAWLDAYLASRSTPMPLYVPVLFAACAAFASLPFVHIDVVIRSSGMIRPISERQEIRAPSGGMVTHTNLVPHTPVTAGAVLVQLRSGADEAEAGALRFQLAALRDEVSDLGRMTRADGERTLNAATFRTEAWREEYARARSEMLLRRLDVAKAETDLGRARALAASQAVPPSEVEAREFAYNQAIATIRQLRFASLAAWKLALADKRVKLRDLEWQYERAAQDQSLRTVSAPLGGTLEEVAAVTTGSYVRPGDVLAIISPDAALIAEVYVPPRDIIWVRRGGHVRLQIDAFNYRDWGLLDAVVQDVAGDVSVTDNKPFFRVRVRPRQTYLTLPNGARGNLRKGMTLTARFSARERTLWQLLRDHASDWLDPDAAGAPQVAAR